MLIPASGPLFMHSGADRFPACIFYIIDPPHRKPLRDRGFIIIGGMGASTPIIVPEKGDFRGKCYFSGDSLACIGYRTDEALSFKQEGGDCTREASRSPPPLFFSRVSREPVIAHFRNASSWMYYPHNDPITGF